MLLYVDKIENNKKHKNFCLQIYLHIFYVSTNYTVY